MKTCATVYWSQSAPRSTSNSMPSKSWVTINSTKHTCRISVVQNNRLVLHTSVRRSPDYPGYERRLWIAAYTMGKNLGWYAKRKGLLGKIVSKKSSKKKLSNPKRYKKILKKRYRRGTRAVSKLVAKHRRVRKALVAKHRRVRKALVAKQKSMKKELKIQQFFALKTLKVQKIPKSWLLKILHNLSRAKLARVQLDKKAAQSQRLIERKVLTRNVARKQKNVKAKIKCEQKSIQARRTQRRRALKEKYRGALKEARKQSVRFALRIKGRQKHAVRGLLAGGFSFNKVIEVRNPSFNGCRHKKTRRK